MQDHIPPFEYHGRITYNRELSIVRNIHLSTLNIGLWWESDIIDVLRLLHYQCGMPSHMIENEVVSPPSNSAIDDEKVDTDWRSRNKAATGLLNQTAVYLPSLVFKGKDPEWLQHWTINACGKKMSLTIESEYIHYLYFHPHI